MKDLSDYRKSYEKGALLESELPESPMDLFQIWFDQADQTTGFEANAMTLSTFGLDGFPNSRVVLLKRFDRDGFVFFTNYDSAKGKALAQHPEVCLSFFWPAHERQVIIKGKAEKTSAAVSEAYFHSRPKASQLSAVVSRQSEVVASRAALEAKLADLEKEFEAKMIPRPEHWGGYLVRPQEIEFWQGRPNRLHDRIRYSLLEEKSWKTDRLSP